MMPLPDLVVPANAKVLHEADDVTVYLTRRGRIGFAYRAGCVQLDPDKWVSLYHEAKHLRKRLFALMDSIWPTRKMAA